MHAADADRLARFVQLAQPMAVAAVTITRPAVAGPDARRQHADRIVRHWRTELAPLAALPGFAGRFGGPVRDVLSATVQGVLALSLAQLCEVTDAHAQVRLLAQIVLDDTLPPGWTPPGAEIAVPSARHSGTGPTAAVNGTAQEQAQWARVMRRVPAGIAAVAREMWAVRRLVDQRAEGRLWHRAVANVPAVGVVGATLGERHAATETAARLYVALGLADELPGI